MNYSKRPCPACGSDTKENLYRQSFTGLSAGTFLRGYDVCSCKKCGFLYADGLPPAEAFDQYYAEMSKWEFLDNGGRESVQDQERFSVVADTVVKLMPDRNGRVLDIGCATGGMLGALKKRGYHQLLGLDPSPQCASLALKNYGIAVHTGAVKAIPDLKPGFDLITILGVLEHIVDPQKTLRDIRAALSSKGLLYVSVPDASRFAQYMDSPFQQFSIEHIMYFTPGSLENLLRTAGFEKVSARETDSLYTRTYNYPSVDMVFRPAAVTEGTYDADGNRAIGEYLSDSAELDAAMAARIQQLVDSQEPVLVWGVGTMTQRLMEKTKLPSAKIVAFVDSNPHYHGKKLKGVPVINPSEVPNHSETILISSLIFESEIRDQIQNQLRCNNPIVTLRPAAAVV
ncbi:MAG TPA: methyltransferase domain-containing protein [Lacunisphaera sp.]|jgi:SAM-dependent methyltransferase